MNYNVEFIEKLKWYRDKCRNMYELCIMLGIDSIGGNTYKEIKNIANENNITIVFNGNKKRIKSEKRKDIQELLTFGSKITSNALKNKLLSSGLKEYKCERCNRTEWEGEPIPLQLHHINGDNTDNRLENLQILCPNCHSLTDNYCGGNNKGKRHLRPSIIRNNNIEYIVDKNFLIKLIFENGINFAANELNVSVSRVRNWCKYYNIPLNKLDKISYIKSNPDILGICPTCGKIFFKKEKKQIYCSVKCTSTHQNKLNVTKQQLIDDFIKYGSFLQLSKVYNVSDKCIVKWFRKFGLPYHKKELQIYLKNND